jgi:hypothetical protein
LTLAAPVVGGEEGGGVRGPSKLEGTHMGQQLTVDNIGSDETTKSGVGAEAPVTKVDKLHRWPMAEWRRAHPEKRER